MSTHLGSQNGKTLSSEMVHYTEEPVEPWDKSGLRSLNCLVFSFSTFGRPEGLGFAQIRFV